MSLASDGGEYIAAVGKATPPIAISGAVAAGWTLQDWVLLATLVYTVVQTVLVIYKFIKGRKDGG